MNKPVDKLESVKASFEHWRKTRARQGKIPDHLWSQVKELLVPTHSQRSALP